MPLNDAAQRFPNLAKAAGSAPVIQKIDSNGALTGESEDLGMMIAPDPVGHFMLVALPDVEAKTKAVLYIPTTVTDRERAASVVGTVIAMGPDCYRDVAPQLPDNLPPGAPVTVLAARPRFPSASI